MVDQIERGLDELRRTPVPVTWADVERRAGAIRADGEAGELGSAAEPFVPASAAPGRSTGQRRTGVLVATAVVAFIGVTAAVVLMMTSDDPHPVHTRPVPSTAAVSSTTSVSSAAAPGIGLPTVVPPSPTPSSTPPAGPAAQGEQSNPVQVWTGSQYLVWGRETGVSSELRTDGWSFNPVTGQRVDIPPSPLSAHRFAAGVWTGTELIVCCGSSVEPDAGAAFDPSTGRWRSLTAAPPHSVAAVVGSAWTGSEMLVLFGSEGRPSDTNQLFAYNPERDAWRRLPDLPVIAPYRPKTAWTGSKLVVWPQVRNSGAGASDPGGFAFDPLIGSWSALPPIPAQAQVAFGDVAGVRGELVVWGLDLTNTGRVGYRLRDGASQWRPMSPPPLPPIGRYYEGLPGSQTLVADDRSGRVVVKPTLADGLADRPHPLLSYDPTTDRWQEVGPAALGYNPPLSVGGGYVFVPDPNAPVVAKLPG